MATKTIFVSILSGVEAKNILRTDILRRLLESGSRVVLFVKSKDRIEYYAKEFSHPNLFYETVERYPFSRLNGFFEALRHYLVRTKTLNLYKRLQLEDRRNYLSFLGSHIATSLLANRLVHAAARFFDFHLCRDQVFAAFFEKYRPDLVFLANLFDEAEVSLLREARRRGVCSVGFVNSWDKVTSKGFIRLLPDRLLVPNDHVRDEAIRYDDAPREKITVVGVPQYDFYLGSQGILPRETFFKKINADPAKKLVVFAPMGTAFSNSDWKIIDLIREVVAGLQVPAELLVRFQPNDFFDQKEEFVRRPWMRYDQPGTRFGSVRGVDWDMSRDELFHLKNTLYHMDVLVSYATSLAIDASCFDKPVINLGFEVVSGQSALKTSTRRYGTEHFSKALQTGGIRMVPSKEELSNWIVKYFRDPSLDREGRTRLRNEQCCRFDGKAGQRIATFILEEAGVR